MISKYSVGFLIPKEAHRHLGDDGWEFESNLRLPADIESLLNSKLSLCESSPDFSAYDGIGIKVNVFKDEQGEIENIYFRFHKGVTPELPDFLKNSAHCKDLEFFIP